MNFENLSEKGLTSFLFSVIIVTDLRNGGTSEASRNLSPN